MWLTATWLFLRAFKCCLHLVSVQWTINLLFQASLISGAREIETLRRELEVSVMERAQLQARVDELLEKASEAERLSSELERLKVKFLYC